MTKSTSGGCDQFETSPEAIEPELRTALCERRQTDRLKTNYRIDYFPWHRHQIEGTNGFSVSSERHRDTQSLV